MSDKILKTPSDSFGEKILSEVEKIFGLQQHHFRDTAKAVNALSKKTMKIAKDVRKNLDWIGKEIDPETRRNLYQRLRNDMEGLLGIIRREAGQKK